MGIKKRARAHQNGRVRPSSAAGGRAGGAGGSAALMNDIGRGHQPRGVGAVDDEAALPLRGAVYIGMGKCRILKLIVLQCTGATYFFIVQIGLIIRILHNILLSLGKIASLKQKLRDFPPREDAAAALVLGALLEVLAVRVMPGAFAVGCSEKLSG